MAASVLERLDRVTSRAAAGRWWSLTVGVTVMAASAFHALPAYDAISGGDLASNHAKGLHLLSHLAGEGPESHAAKLDFRLVVPLLLRPFGGSLAAAAILFALCGVVAYALWATELARARVAPTTVLLALAAVAVTPAGGVFLLAVRYFDAVAIVLAVAASVVRRPWVAAALAFVALYTDERAVIALALALLGARWLDAHSSEPPARGLTFVGVGAAIGAYGLTRIALDATTDLRTESAGVGLEVVTRNIDAWPIGLVTAFVFFWVAFAVGLALIARDGVGKPLVALFVLAVASAVMVDDLTRSVAYVLPVVPAVVAAIARRWPARTTARAFGLAFVLGMFVPAFGMVSDIGRENPLPIHVLRWTGLL